MKPQPTTKREVAREVEWRRCERDPLYFLENYWHIQVIGKGWEIIKPYVFQREDFSAIHAAAYGTAKDRQIRLKARQIGWTTIGAAYCFWSAWFHADTPWLIASQGEKDAQRTLSLRIKQPYLRLPAWMRERGPKLTSDNQEQMDFDNGSRIVAIPSTSASARGDAVYGVLMDEAAFMDNAVELYGALDPLCYGPMFVFSTANGMGNFFHDTWNDAQLSDSEWSSSFRPWSARPDRDQKWYERTKRKYRTQPWLFYQEYPTTPAEAFAKSGRTAWDLESLKTQGHWCEPEARYDLTLFTSDNPEAARITSDTERDLELWVWEPPTVERNEHGIVLRKPNFVVGVDVSEGLDHGDRSSIVVTNANTLEVVATFRGHIPVEDLGAVCETIGYWYHTALVVVERNNMGLVPLVYLQEARYPRLYRMESIAVRGGVRTPRYGWHTNRSTKPKMVIEFGKALRDDVLLLHDERLLEEAATFIADGKGSYGASSGNYDDHVLGHLISYQGALDAGQYPIVWVDPTPGPLTIGQMLEAMDNATKDPKGFALGRPIGQATTTYRERHSFEVPAKR